MPKLKIKKSTLKNVKLGTLSIVLSVLALVLLVIIPQSLKLAQGHILVSANLETPAPQPQVAGVEKAPSLTSKGLTAPQFSSAAIIALDFDTGDILYQKNIHQRLFPASTTKITTALIAVDQFRQSDILTVIPEDIVGGSTMGLQTGEKLSFRSLLYGMLLNSGNDAAFTIASNYPGGLTNFVASMNLRIKELGLSDTHFQNPAGFDDPQQYTSAYDLSQIALAAAKSQELLTVVATDETSVASLDSRVHYLHSLNKLLNINGVIGFKTGTTEEAGQNFVGLVERGGHKVITVVLNSSDRFNETKNLMDWTYSNYSWN